MNTNLLSVSLAENEGALTRLIGLVERRGFSINALDKSAPAGGESRITMEVCAREDARRIDVLARQVSRLLDVNTIFAPQDIHVSNPTGRQSCRPQT
jgi:acetolactate synthase regulatory subunit